MGGFQCQRQRLAIARGEVTADAHGQLLAVAGDHVAVGVAAQPLANVRLHGQLAVAFAATVEVFRADAEGDRIARVQRGAAHRQEQPATGVELDFAAAGFDTACAALEKAHLRCAEKACDEEVGGIVIELHG